MEIYIAKHRRYIPFHITDTDAMQNNARCVNFGMYGGTLRHESERFCPRHNPDAYAKHEARHATVTSLDRMGLIYPNWQ